MHVVKAYPGGGGSSRHSFLISAPDGSEWSASHKGHFTPCERAPGTHWIGGEFDPLPPTWTLWRREEPLAFRLNNILPSLSTLPNQCLFLGYVTRISCPTCPPLILIWRCIFIFEISSLNSQRIRQSGCILLSPLPAPFCSACCVYKARMSIPVLAASISVRHVYQSSHTKTVCLGVTRMRALAAASPSQQSAVTDTRLQFAPYRMSVTFLIMTRRTEVIVHLLKDCGNRAVLRVGSGAS